MSGVFGFVDVKEHAQHEVILKKMSDLLSHRQWFKSRFFADKEKGVYLADIGIGVFNIITPPCSSEDSKIHIFLTGELYETNDVKKALQARGYHFRNDTDTELVLRLYQADGFNFIHKLQGVFLVLIYDKSRGELILANDRFGLYPLYYSHRDGTFVFGPEVKAILAHNDFLPVLDPVAMAEYFRFQFLLGDKTFFQDIKLLPNAALLRFNISENKLHIDRYWDFSEIHQSPDQLFFDDVVEEASRLLKRSIDRLTQENRRYGVYLSGGLDSRVILGMMARKTKPIAITYGLPYSRDMILAEKIAKKLHLVHHRYSYDNGCWVLQYHPLHLALTEGFHSWIHSHGISILDDVHFLMDVNLTGFGGGLTYVDWEDEVLFHSTDEVTFVCRLFNLLGTKTTWLSLDEAEEKMLYNPKIRREMLGLAYDSFCQELKPFEHLSYSQRAAYFALCNPDRRLFQYFTVFHRAFIEQRFPFYDYDYFNFVYSLPPSMNIKRKLRRAVIRKTMPELAKIPYDKDMLPISGNSFSQNLSTLLKKGKSYVNRNISPIFKDYAPLHSDYESWLRCDLRTWAEELLFSDRTLERGIINREFLHSIWNRLLSGLEPNIIGKLAPIMTYELMLRQYYDKGSN